MELKADMIFLCAAQSMGLNHTERFATIPDMNS